MEPFKNIFNPTSISELAGLVERIAGQGFNNDTFQHLAGMDLEGLELKDRVIQITDALRKTLPENYEEALAILVDVPERSESETLTSGFIFWPLLRFIEDYGLENFDLSLQAMKKLTSVFSAEFAIRPFLLKDSNRVLEEMNRWTDSPSEHIRRLASEGCRPRLPWGIALPEFIADPTLSLSILEALQSDESEYVRRSVSNHINDFSRDFPKHVTDLCSRWAKDDTPERKKLIKHALRNLLKKGNRDALEILGFGSPRYSSPVLSLESTSIKMGEWLVFELNIEGESAQSWMIDYAIHHLKANGKTSPKVFKWTTKTVNSSTKLTIRKKHSFKPITTRKYYTGEHEVEIFVNGQSVSRLPFHLEV